MSLETSTRRILHLWNRPGVVCRSSQPARADGLLAIKTVQKQFTEKLPLVRVGSWPLWQDLHNGHFRSLTSGSFRASQVLAETTWVTACARRHDTADVSLIPSLRASGRAHTA